MNDNDTNLPSKSDREPVAGSDPTSEFLKKVLIFIVIALSTTLLVLFVGRAIDTLMVIFAGVLLGIIFRALRDLLHDRTGISKSFALAVVVILYLGVTLGSAAWLVPKMYNEGSQFYDQLPKTWDSTKPMISRFGWGRELALENPNFRDFFEDETGGTGEDHDMTKAILGYLSSAATAIAAVVLVILIAIYIAAEPKLYSEGFMRLFPKGRRRQVLDIMDEISVTMQWWLVGQICSMLLLGSVTSLGLWLLGVPYALLLGGFTALMTFVPNLGPLISAVPILVISLTVDVETTIYVAILFLVLQIIEGYYVTPTIQRRAISVPPVLIIVVQFLLYYLVGFLGVLLAMPLLGCAIVLVKRLYMENILGDTARDTTSFDLQGKTIF